MRDRGSDASGCARAFPACAGPWGGVSLHTSLAPTDRGRTIGLRRVFGESALGRGRRRSGRRRLGPRIGLLCRLAVVAGVILLLAHAWGRSVGLLQTALCGFLGVDLPVASDQRLLVLG